MNRLVLPALVGAVALTALAPAAPVVAAEFGPSVLFDGTAVAYGNLVTASNPSIPLGVGLDETTPEARARLTSLGESSALATGPYLGDTVIGFLFSQAGGQGVGGVNYPFMAATSSGDRPKDVTTAGLALHAESGVNLAAARGTVGEGASQSVGTARVERVDGGTTARSESLTDGLVLFDKLLVSGVRATAQTTVTDQGKRTSSASFSIGRLTAQGLTITIPAASPVGAGQSITGPDLGYVDGEFFIELPGVVSQKVPVDASAVQKALGQAGIAMTLQESSKTATGIIAPAVSFAFVLPAPPDNPQYTGPTPVSITIGRAATSVTVRGTTGTSFTAAPSIPVSEPVVGAPDGASLPGLGTTDGLAPQASTPGHVDPPAVASAPDAAVSVQGGLASAERVALRRADLSNIYLALVLLGMVSAAAFAVVRALGVRYLWAS